MHDFLTPRLRVLMLSTLFPDASRPFLAPFVVRQAQALAALPEIDLRVVAPLPMPPFPLSRHPRYAGRRGIPAHEVWEGLDVVRPRFNPWPLTGGRFSATALAQAVTPVVSKIHKDQPFDVLAAQYFFPDGPAAVAIGDALSIPVSIKARGSDIHYWGRKRATARQVLEAGKAANGLLCVSEALRGDMVTLGMQRDRIMVHYTGVDLDAFPVRQRSSLKTALGVSGKLIVCVGALIPRKGQRLLLAALQNIPDAQLVLIGDGPDRAVLEAQARHLQIADRVRLTGALDHEQVGLWLGAADVMALPSISEGLANAWLEALSCGTPIVISSSGGAAEVLQDRQAGRIASRSPSAFAQAICETLENPPSPQACREVAERFSWSRNAAELRDHLLLLTGK